MRVVDVTEALRFPIFCRKGNNIARALVKKKQYSGKISITYPNHPINPNYPNLTPNHP